MRFLGLFTGLKCDGRRVGTILVGTHDRYAHLRAPGFELIGGAHHHLLAVGHEQTSQLARSGGLTGAVHADHDDDARLVRTFLVGVKTTIRIGADQLEQFVFQGFAHFGRIGLTADAGIVTQFLNQLFAGLGADVSK